eukprot:CAMPEP_0167761096 /NCGR_PEP_ID=MMETSP0110_2-20121227/11969_1 /TAXON_ID=629695 /ORGANISM="Gymnochlora sp., Strain CCMP2014" /LENGTH=104 /DNA_ID=CAMNT_0007647715 /DNA_START=142 /DNA_END=456 /DNA_ORIENTATION=-
MIRGPLESQIKMEDVTNTDFACDRASESQVILSESYSDTAIYAYATVTATKLNPVINAAKTPTKKHSSIFDSFLTSIKIAAPTSTKNDKTNVDTAVAIIESGIN